MFGIGTTELLVILAVALIVIGPKKLPEIARTLGKAMGEFRRVTTDVQRTINTEIEREDLDKKTKEEEKRLSAKAKKTDGKALAKDAGEQGKDAQQQADKAYGSAMDANTLDAEFRESEPALRDSTPESAPPAAEPVAKPVPKSIAKSAEMMRMAGSETKAAPVAPTSVADAGKDTK